MRNKGISKLLSHWQQTVENPGMSPLQFYEIVVDSIRRRALPGVLISTVVRREGGAFSQRRIYLRVLCGKLSFDISAAVFGNSIVFAWWLSEAPPGLVDLFWEVPLLGVFLRELLRPTTFYTVDLASAFQHAVDDSVREAIEALQITRANRRDFDGNVAPIFGGFYTDD